MADVVGLDSSFCRPSASQARQAAAAGVRVWSGYVATRAGVGLAATWGQADFENARVCGGTPLAYASGWDDPAALRKLAATWNVRLVLDVESGIRGDGPWVQGWLDASGAGLYGPHGVHPGRRAAFHILAAYPASGDPFGASWDSSPRPPGPCGWQWAGTHDAFGCSVDSTWFDDWFLTGGDDMTPDQAAQLARIDGILSGPPGSYPDAWLRQFLEGLKNSEIAVMAGEVDALVAHPVNVDALAAALAPHLQAVDEAKLSADLEAALPGPVAGAVRAALAKALGAG